MNALDAADGELFPAEWFAITVKVYGVPFVRPVTMRGEALPVAVIPPGFAVTV